MDAIDAFRRQVDPPGHCQSSLPHTSQNGPPPLGTAGGTGQDVVAGPTTELKQEVRRLRGETVALRVNLQNERQHCNRQRALTLQADADFMQLCKDFAESVNGVGCCRPGPGYGDVQNAWKNLEHSSNAVRQLDEALRERETRLNFLENLLTQKEDLLSGGSQQNIQENIPFYSWSQPGNGFGLRNIPWTRSVSSVVTDPMEREFYDKIGHLHILQERFYNLQFEHQRRMLEREAQVAQNLRPRTSDEEFLLSYFRERQSLIQEYFQTREEVFKLLDDCRKAGLDVEEPSLPVLIDENMKELNALPPTTPANQMSRFEMTGLEKTISIGLDSSFQEFLRSHRRKAYISDWIDTTEGVRPGAKDTNTFSRRASEISNVENGGWEIIDANLGKTPLRPTDASSATRNSAISSNTSPQLPKLGKFHGDPPVRRYSEPDMRKLTTKPRKSSPGKHLVKDETFLRRRYSESRVLFHRFGSLDLAA